MNEHYRMNYEWYAKQVLELNNITEPNFIKELSPYNGVKLVFQKS